MKKRLSEIIERNQKHLNSIDKSIKELVQKRQKATQMNDIYDINLQIRMYKKFKRITKNNIVDLTDIKITQKDEQVFSDETIKRLEKRRAGNSLNNGNNN